MDEVELRRMHDEAWPWCPFGVNRHTHTETLGEGSRVNDHPAGPMWRLLELKP